MAIAGNNIKIRIFRINYANDDIVGGAVVTGTVVGDYPARLQANPVEQILEQQGLETDRTFKLNIVPGYLDIRERDELTVIAPTDHIYYNKWFRVRGVSYSSLNKRDPRNYMMLTVSRSVRAHSDLLIASNTTTTLYDRIVALEPTIFLPLGDTTSPMLDVMGYGGRFNITGTAWSSVSYSQAGIEAGHSSLLMVSGSVGRADATYTYAQTPRSVMSGGIFIKFVPPYLSYGVSNNCILRLCDFAGVDDIDIFKSSGTSAVDFVFRTGGVKRLVTITGIDYGWHSYYWTINRSQDRFRGYFDGVLIGELNSLASWTTNDWSAYLGATASNPILGTLSAYVQYQTIWASRELTQTEITSIATV